MMVDEIISEGAENQDRALGGGRAPGRRVIRRSQRGERKARHTMFPPFQRFLWSWVFSAKESLVYSANLDFRIQLQLSIKQTKNDI